jgi:hypothetical protein
MRRISYHQPGKPNPKLPNQMLIHIYLFTIISKSKLFLLDTGIQRSQQNHTSYNDTPMVNLECCQIVVCPRRSTHRSAQQKDNHIAGYAMVLVHALRSLNRPVDLREEVLCYADGSLNQQENIGNQPQNGMR